MGSSPLAWVFIDLPPEAYEAASRFWAAVLGEEPVSEPGDENYGFFPTPVSVRVGLQRLGGEDSARLHLDVPAGEVESEARRLEELGAARVRTLEDHVILRDPAGLLFCVVPSKWAAEAPLPVGPD
jgi:catechol 2,3-dioxygenase-like lactoylglutathione lyase family enzyme